MKLLQIEHQLATPYHPQVSLLYIYIYFFSAHFNTPTLGSLDERFNQTLQNMLVKYISDKKEQWDQFLDMCMYAYNTSQHDSTHFSLMR